MFGASDTINTTVTIREGDTIVSRGKTFELGFFSPSNSLNRYIAIWYYGIPVTTIWLANPQAPLTLRNSTSGVLKLTQSGDLVVLDETNNNTIWSSNTSRVLRDPVAVLLDTGNLVIRESSDPENYLWQSFDIVSDTGAQGKAFGWNLVTGTEHYIRSWTSDSDPSPGVYTVHLDIAGYPQMVLKRDNVTVLSRIGPWNGVHFSGTGLPPNITSLRLAINSTVVYLSEQYIDPSMMSRFRVDPAGVTKHFTWISQIQDWHLDNNFPADICDTYGYCGAYGSCYIFNTIQPCNCLDKFIPRNRTAWDNSVHNEGCVRRTALNCSTDVFIPYQGIKLPDSHSTRFNESLTLKECEAECLRECNCTAYSNLDIRNGGSGCLLWFGDLVDIRQLAGEEQRIYIRMASSELDTRRKILIPVLASVVGALVVLVFGLVLFICKRKKRKEKKKRLEVENEDKDIELPIFDLATIIRATDDFSLSNKLGQGGFGQVFKGILEDGKEIAVKRLSRTSTQGLDEFKNEVIFIAKLQHRNLVKLLGCCFQKNEKMLVYEYMPNKSLDYILFDGKQSRMLDWPKRFHIINGIARGILYLHQDSHLRIIHRDLKASNILLDADMNPKISDFGLAKSFGGDQTEGNTSRVVGTYGYMSPEYAIDGLFSTKSDVFSFGVLALEIVTGRRNRGFRHEGHLHNLLGHAWILHEEGRSFELVDSNLDKSYSSYFSQVLRSIHVALLCVQQNLDDRPSMSSVVVMLSGEGILPEVKQPGFFSERDVMGVENTSSTNPSSISNNEATVSEVVGR